MSAGARPESTAVDAGAVHVDVRRVAFFTIARKEIRRFIRIWPQTLVPP